MFTEDFSQFVLDKGFYLWNENDAKKFAACASEAFMDYPLMAYFFEEDIRKEAIECEMEMTFSEQPKDIVIFADSPEINCVCMMGAPFLNNVVDVGLLSGNVMKIKGHCKYKNIKRLIDFQRYCVEVKYRHTGGDALHCVFLATKPSEQKKGLGTKILTAVHEYADMINKPIFLDTHKPLNVEIYKKLGYTLMSADPYEGTDTLHHGLVRFPFSNQPT